MGDITTVRIIIIDDVVKILHLLRCYKFSIITTTTYLGTPK